MSSAAGTPFRIHRDGDVVCCRIEGEFTLDATTRFKDAMEPHLQAKTCSMVIVDLERVRFMDSTGIGSLVALNTRMQGLEIPLHLLKPSVQVRKVLELVQLARYFSMVDDVQALSLPGNTCGEDA